MPTPSAIAPLCLVSTIAAAGSVATAQCPPVRFVSPDGPDADRFAGAITSNAGQGGGQWAIEETNQVWAYELVDGRLELRQALRAPVPFFTSLFGYSMDMHGDRLVVGVWSAAWPDRPRSTGGAFVFDLVDGQWIPTAEIRPPLDLAIDAAGGRVAVEGDTIFAGGGSGSPPIIVYEPAPGEPDRWIEVQRLEGPIAIVWGLPIVPHGDWVFVGAHRDDSVDRFGGSVFVYRRDAAGRYQQVQKIDGPDEAPYTVRYFGQSLDTDGRTLAIGALGAAPESDSQGAVFVYELEGERWTRRQTLTHRGAQEADVLGASQLRVDGDRLLAVAIGDRSGRAGGMVYAFERTAAGLWRQSARLLPNSPDGARQYGGNMALHGDLALVGASGERVLPSADRVGAAYLFDLSCYACPDLDGDDRLTVFDSLEFLRAFQAGEAIADFDNDGQLTALDFLAFQDAFAVGCP
ncbi:MAG: GC-type dockerin domain-anchored protein [Phycisphaerales bacterium]